MAIVVEVEPFLGSRYGGCYRQVQSSQARRREVRTWVQQAPESWTMDLGRFVRFMLVSVLL